jgi:hypothetical protein
VTTIASPGCVAGRVVGAVPVPRQRICVRGAPLESHSDDCDDCGPMVLEGSVVEMLYELNEPPFGGYEMGEAGGSRGHGWAFSHPVIGHDKPFGQRADLGCHLSQSLTLQFLPSPQVGA